MGWTCQHDHKGYCKLIKKPCVPGMNGCILKSSDGIIFSDGNLEKDKKKEEKNGEIDFAALARSN
ncbi:MAG: hypothetical protein KAT10_02410 [Sulfurimonas sp.]|nr:hypothetical protein [Sulfurimonas sp.]